MVSVVRSVTRKDYPKCLIDPPSVICLYVLLMSNTNLTTPLFGLFGEVSHCDTEGLPQVSDWTPLSVIYLSLRSINVYHESHYSFIR